MIILLIYLANMFGSLGVFLLFFETFLLIVFIVILMMMDSADTKDKSLVKLLKSILITALISALLLIFIPSEKTIYLMIGANYLKDSQLPTKIESVLNKKLDEYLTEDKK